MLVIIQLVVVGVVLALTVVSFAWFTSNTHVYTSNVTVLSETSSDVSVVLEPDEYTPIKEKQGKVITIRPTPILYWTFLILQ